MRLLSEGGNGSVPIKSWTEGVQVEEEAIQQLRNVASLPFVYKWIAAMPDIHLGQGCCIGSVIPTLGAVIPAAVGVDIACGVAAVKTSLKASDIPVEKRHDLRLAIEHAVPAGRTNNGRKGDRGAWGNVPPHVGNTWEQELKSDLEIVIAKHSGAKPANDVCHLGTLGGGNHFCELSLDKDDNVWIMLHSGSRGPGNRIGTYFINLAKERCEQWFVKLPDPNLAYFPQDTEEFHDYIFAARWAQKFAELNREIMLANILKAMFETGTFSDFTHEDPINCHHNYLEWESHFGKNVIVTRKGAIRAREGELGIIPGSMGSKSYITKGKGNKDSFCSASHGAGRAMSRTKAIKTFSVEDHIKATEGVECVKDATVLDETPGAYKSIDAVMAAQTELVEPIVELKQIISVKGAGD